MAKANDLMARLLSQFKFKKSTKALYNAAAAGRGGGGKQEGARRTAEKAGGAGGGEGRVWSRLQDAPVPGGRKRKVLILRAR